MTSIAVVHYNFTYAGGAEKLAGSLVKALRESGFDAKLVTMNIDPDTFRLLGLPELPYTVLHESFTASMARRIHQRMRRFGKIYSYILYSSLLGKLDYIRSLGFDMIVETQLNYPLPVDVSYIHYPVTLQGTSSTTSLPRRLYNKLSDLLWKRVKGNPRLVLTNSTWTMAKTLDAFPGLSNVKVLHPAVDYEYFASARRRRREKIVVTVSRLIPSKKIDAVLRAASELREYRFILVGSTIGYSRMNYLAQLEKMASSLPNVEIMPNAPREAVRDLLGRALFYLHPPYPEHFGIAVAEAASAGAIPIVFKDGGAWTDIVSRIDERLGYEDIAEAASIIRQIENDPELERLSARYSELASQFRYENFRKNVKNIFRELENDNT